MDPTLDELAQKHRADKASTHLDYTRHYEHLFEPLRHQPIRLLEIGVLYGASIRMWLDYFPQAQVFGFDITPRDIGLNDPRFTYVYGDQTKPTDWQNFLQFYDTPWDIIIDDGSHFSDGIITSFQCLWPAVKPGGYYCIEDLMVAYSPVYQKPGFQNQMEFIQDLMDDINQRGKNYYSNPNPPPNPTYTDLELTLESLHFTKGLAILRKRL
jgi:demethylmacrocin O-methyltransferase